MKKFHVGVKGLILNDNKVLLLKSVKGYWELPGGRIDGDEMIDQTLTRELREEVHGIESVEINKIVHACRMPFDIDEDLGLVLIFVEASVITSGDIIISEEHVDFGWYSLSEAEKLIKDDTLVAVQKVLK